ncbi:MAG TPA: hypothetical protein VF723_03115 [Pyrinomonadaceae bacterium]|jgi:hypothetical protein
MRETKKNSKQGNTEPVGQKPAAAPGFEVNSFYEALLEMREQKPAAFKSMSAATRLAVEAYVKAKQAFNGQEVFKSAA